MTSCYIKQFIVLASIGHIILGVATDAGGNNSHLFKLLRSGKAIKSIGWLRDDEVSFKNPAIFEGPKVAMWHCTTHAAKAKRNAHMSSCQLGKRNFTSKDGVEFGWDNVTETYVRDQKRVSGGAPPETDLTLASVIPDSYNKMTVKHSKAPYTYKTLNEQFTNLGGALGCLKEMLQKGTFSESKKFRDVYKFRLETLRHTINKPNVDAKLKSAFANLEYSVAVDGI